VRYDERRRTEEMIHVVSAIGRKLQASKQALNTATSENIIEQSKQHLALLTEYRVQLYKLHVGVVTDAPGMGCIADFSARTVEGREPSSYLPLVSALGIDFTIPIER
jgi:hypothetical protein